MDEFDFYQGSHTGGEIDNDLDMIENRLSDIHDPSYFSLHTGDALVTEWGIFKAIESRIIELTIPSITGSGTVTGDYAQVTMGFTPKVTDRHKVIAYSFSNPSAVTGDWTITTVDGQITYSGSLNGTTDLTVILGCIGQDVARMNA